MTTDQPMSPHTANPMIRAAMTDQIQRVRISWASSVIPEGQPKRQKALLRSQPVNTVGNSVEIPILVLPTNERIRFQVASADVIHSFWVPEFLFKLDVIPGNENGRDNVFEVTVREQGAFVGRCAELCGTYHAYMNFEVRAVSGADYDAYLAARESGLNTYDALESIGQPGHATSTSPFDLVDDPQRADG